MTVGTNIFELDWDVLIILDACRVDALEAVATEYPFVPGNVESIRSVGSSTPEWIVSTFTNEYADTLRNTAYIVRNGFAYKVFEEGYRPSDFFGIAKWDVIDTTELGYLEHVWMLYGTDPSPKKREGYDINENLRFRDPRIVTDRAIDVIRNNEFDRTVVHYSRPHDPYIANALEENRDLYEYEEDPFGYLERTGDRERVYEAYLDDLRLVLDEVSVLLENVSADTVVISADHGEAFGEYGVTRHPTGTFHPNVLSVPWVSTTAEDTGSYEPDTEYEKAERSVDEALEALGYKM